MAVSAEGLHYPASMAESPTPASPPRQKCRAQRLPKTTKGMLIALVAVYFLGSLAESSHRLLDLVPVHAHAALPGGPFHAAPVAWLLLIDAMLIGVGLAAFLRRDLRRELLSRLPNLRCLMLTSFTSDEAMLDAILAGASGYVVKDIKGMELAQAIKDVGAGRSLLDNRAAAALMAKLRGAAEHSDPLSGLSDQEKVLLDLLGEGLTNKQIAARMFLAEKTVKNYVSRLLAKLGMERRTQAAVFVSKLDRDHRRTDE